MISRKDFSRFPGLEPAAEAITTADSRYCGVDPREMDRLGSEASRSHYHLYFIRINKAKPTNRESVFRMWSRSNGAFFFLSSRLFDSIPERRGYHLTMLKIISKIFNVCPKGNISMTDASGKPYVRARSPTHNGSVVSLATMSTTTSNGSSVMRSPLRSSLKKPRPQNDGGPLGIHNPGFSQGSPTFQRNGSVKKVRIQSHTTAV